MIVIGACEAAAPGGSNTMPASVQPSGVWMVMSLPEAGGALMAFRIK
jgi:hypothetical protein